MDVAASVGALTSSDGTMVDGPLLFSVVGCEVERVWFGIQPTTGTKEILFSRPHPQGSSKRHIIQAAPLPTGGGIGQNEDV